MNGQSRYIAIEGAIGVGKSSLTHLIADRFDTDPLYEAVDENPFLKQFYQERKNMAFQTQMFFLLSRYKQLIELNQVDLFNRAVVCDYMFDRDYVFAQINLDDQEFAMYLELYRLLKKQMPTPDLTIFLQASTKTLMTRIKLRDRDVERGVDESYIEQVNDKFNEFFFGYKGGPLLIINTDSIDFVKNEEDFDKLMVKIMGDVRGVEFFNPESSIL